MSVRLLVRLFAQREFVEQPYSTEVLCSNWIARPLEQPALAVQPAVPEHLREVDVLTFLARIYASQHC
jgi:hypothetical protein